MTSLARSTTSPWHTHRRQPTVTEAGEGDSPSIIERGVIRRNGPVFGRVAVSVCRLQARVRTVRTTKGFMNVNENEPPVVRVLPTRTHTNQRLHPRHSEDAVLPAALVRQRLDHERPTWLSDEASMPSERVWRLLTDGR